MTVYEFKEARIGKNATVDIPEDAIGVTTEVNDHSFRTVRKASWLEPKEQ